MNGEFFEVVEWRIENICAWSPEVFLLSSISSPGTLQNKTTYFELEPGVKGLESYTFSDIYLTIRIKNKECANLSGDLSLIASDGYLLSFHLVNTWSNDEIFQGPKLKDVVARIRNSESSHKDYITMQCRFKSANPCKHVMSSSILASEMSLKFDPQFIENLTTSKYIAHVKCPFDKVEMLFKVEVNEEEEKIIFSLVSNESLDSKWLKSCMSFLSSEGKIVRRESREHLLYEEGPSCTEIYSLEKQELIGKNITLLLHFKFLNDEIKGYHSKISCLAKNVSIMPKNNLCFCKKKSSDSLKTSKQLDKSVTVLSKDLLCLYQDKEFSDMQLKCEGVSFPVHRNILSARSPVFKRLLLSGMRETVSGTVDIKDLDASTLSLFLAHLYAGTAQFAGMQFESCLKLYYAADKYDVPTLKRECSDFFRTIISVSNVCDILSLADKHQDDLLTISAYAFILRNLQEVLGTEEWKSFVKSKPLLVAELLTNFVQKKYVKSSIANFGNVLP